MAPIRRYLRISKYSVLECRIFLENPADPQRWLLNPRDPVLPRVFESIKPLILPKLREENERAKGKGKKKKSVKDVVAQDDFEVSIFLTEIGTRHSLLTKSKTFKAKGKIVSNSGRLTGTDDSPIQIQDDAESVMIRGESDDDEIGLNLEDIPTADPFDNEGETRSKRQRNPTIIDSGSSDEDSELAQGRPPSKRSKTNQRIEPGPEDDKKKLGLNTAYEGFSIWGWVLCLLITRKDGSGKKSGSSSDSTGQAVMEEWIASTQDQGDYDGD